MHAILAAIFSRFRIRKARPHPPMRIACLLKEEADRRVMAELCERHRWEISFLADLGQMRALLADGKFQIVLLDRDLAGDNWRPAMIRASTGANACVLLISKVLDDYLWNEVVRNGGYDVLVKPLREADVYRALKLAWSYWISARSGSGPRRPWWDFAAKL